ncbi:MAG: hypothetical protein ACOCRN_03585 [Spirochaetia bacterium]
MSGSGGEPAGSGGTPDGSGGTPAGHHGAGKQGRGREYPRTSGWECADRIIDEQLALTGELIERVVDQVNDLPCHALSFRPAGVGFSIAKLVLHLAESERRQLSRLAEAITTRDASVTEAPGATEPIGSRGSLDSQTTAALEHSHILSDKPVPDHFLDGVFLAEVMRSVFRNVTVPICRSIPSANAPLSEKSPFATPREALTHMHWHWTYHSGQIGLLRLQWGDDYVWTLKDNSG